MLAYLYLDDERFDLNRQPNGLAGRIRARDAAERAIALDPSNAQGLQALIALGHYMPGDDKQALEWMRRVDLKRFALYHLVAALIFARAGLEGEAKASAAEFMRMRSRFCDDLDAELAMRNFNARNRAILIAGARQAGFPIGAGVQ